jgi:hypothetical protein
VREKQFPKRKKNEKKTMEQNKDYLVATSTLNNLLQQQQQLTDNEEQLSKVCFDRFVDFIEFETDAVTLRNEKIG